MDREQVRDCLRRFGGGADDWFTLRPTADPDRFMLAAAHGATVEVVVTDRYVEIVGRRSLDPGDEWQAEPSVVPGSLVRTEVRQNSTPTLTVSGRVYLDGFSLHAFLVTASDVLALTGSTPELESAPHTESPALTDRIESAQVTADGGHAPHDAAREPVAGSAPLADALTPVQMPTFDPSPPTAFHQPSEPSEDLPPEQSPAEPPDVQTADTASPPEDPFVVSAITQEPTPSGAEAPAVASTLAAAPADPRQESDRHPQEMPARADPKLEVASPFASASAAPERLVSETIRIPRSELFGPPVVPSIEAVPPPQVAVEAAQSGPASEAPSVPHRCASCGTEVQVGERFCINCGARQDAPAPSSEPTPTAPPASERTTHPSGSPWQRRDSTEMACRRCGHANPSDSRHCESCGAPLVADAAPATAAPALVTCPNCRFTNRLTNRFCQGCGQPL